MSRWRKGKPLEGAAELNFDLLDLSILPREFDLTMSCPECFSGHKHFDDPQGRVEVVHGRECYIAEPKGKPPKGIIIIISDAFGLPFVNNKILADHYSSMGDFKVYLPDFFDGTAAPEWIMPTMGELLDTSSIWGYFMKP
jgi:hypothetical protein